MTFPFRVIIFHKVLLKTTTQSKRKSVFTIYVVIIALAKANMNGSHKTSQVYQVSKK